MASLFDYLPETIAHVQIESQFTDAINFSLNRPDPNASAGESIFLKVLKPKVSVITAVGTETFAPYGSPDPGKRRLYKWGVMGAVGFFALIMLLKR